MSNVIKLKPNSSQDVREVVKTVNELITDEDIDEIIVILHKADKSDIYVKGTVRNRWEFVGFIEEIKHWLLTPEEP